MFPPLPPACCAASSARKSLPWPAASLPLRNTADASQPVPGARMNPQALNVLIHHPDPILSAGLVAALRQHGMFEVFVHGVDNLGDDGPRIDALVADFEGAMRLVDPA